MLNKTWKHSILSACVSVSVLTVGNPVEAAVFTIPINTGNQGKSINPGDVDPSFTWNYTGNSNDPRYSTYVVKDNGGLTWIMNGGDITSNHNYGSDVPSNMPSFSGVGYLYHDFYLPENAFNIKLEFNAIAADDRVVLSLNDTELGRFAFALPPNTLTSGVMMDGQGNDHNKIFDGNGWDGPFIFNDQNLFKPGENNVLRFWTNNTFSPDPMAKAKFLSTEQGDNSWTDYRFAISYETPDTPSVPEPTVVLGLLVPLVFGLKSHSKQQQ